MKFFLALIYVLMLPALVLAQDTDINVGQLLSPWVEALMSALLVLVTAIIGWIAAAIQRRTGIEIEAKHREALQTALTNAAGLVLNKVKSSLSDVTIDVRHPAIKDAILYINGAVPDAIKNFGLSPDDLAEKLLAKIGVVTAPTTEPK
jgi:hypothetical protein